MNIKSTLQKYYNEELNSIYFSIDEDLKKIKNMKLITLVSKVYFVLIISFSMAFSILRVFTDIKLYYFFANFFLYMTLFYLISISLIKLYGLFSFYKEKSMLKNSNNIKKKFNIVMNKNYKVNIDRVYENRIIKKIFPNSDDISHNNNYKFNRLSLNYLLSNDENKYNDFIQYLEKCCQHNISVSNNKIESEYFNVFVKNEKMESLKNNISKFNDVKLKYSHLFDMIKKENTEYNQIGIAVSSFDTLKNGEYSLERLNNNIQDFFNGNELKVIKEYELFYNINNLFESKMTIDEKSRFDVINNNFINLNIDLNKLIDNMKKFKHEINEKYNV